MSHTLRMQNFITIGILLLELLPLEKTAHFEGLR